MKSKILLVEDDHRILYNVKILLEFNDYEVVTASNGIEALKVLLSHEIQPDLIICDILMPEMNGYEFFQEVMENPYWSVIPFIFLTAKASPDDMNSAKILGVDDYIIKPFDEKFLLERVSEKLSRKNKTNCSDLHKTA